MKHIIIRLLFAVLAILTSTGVRAAGYEIDNVPNVQNANRNAYVSDPDHFLSPSATAQTDSILADIRRQTTAEVTFVIIGNMEPRDGIDIDTYATELFEKWGIGDKSNDNGVLLLVAVDDRKFVLRTGKGVEGILPDMICREITENNLVPAFKEGDYSKGIVSTARQLRKVMTDPKYRDELKADLSARERQNWIDLINFVLVAACLLTAVLGISLMVMVNRRRGQSGYEKYVALRPYKLLFLICCFVGIGLPVIVYLPYLYLMNKWRNGDHACPNCHTLMNKLDEESDNKYLTPAQDAEERYDSVDYDVWLCPSCGETDVYPFVNKQSQLGECPHCHARTLRQLQDRIVVQPTERREGQGIREFACLNCGYRHGVPYNIAKLASPGIVILPGGFGGRGGGGGFSGGGFGGGSTGGGGFSGGW